MSQQQNVVEMAPARARQAGRLAEQLFSGLVDSRKVRMTVESGALVLTLTGRGVTDAHAAAASELGFVLEEGARTQPLAVQRVARELNMLRLRCDVPWWFDRWRDAATLAVTYGGKTRRFATVPR